MSHKNKAAGKTFEREIGARVGGARYPADTGGAVDVESPELVLQCKHRRALSLSAINDLALAVATAGTACGKLGVLALKCRRGRGLATPALFVVTEGVFDTLLEALRANRP